MRLFTLLGSTIAVQTSFDDAITALSTRYNDLGLKRLDRNRFLKRKTTSLHKRLTRKLNAARNRGCTVDSVDHDFSLNINRRCNAKATLIADAENAKLFFDNHRKCAPFVRMIERVYTSKYDGFFGTDPVTCEVNLASAFGKHSSAVGRVQGDAIVFDGIKYGDHQRFMRATAASNPTSNDFSSPSVSCPTASNVLTGSTTLPRSTPEDEDCLYLKITAPLSAFEEGASQSKVVTWIHGGTFNYGGMDVMFEDPTPLVAEQDIIVVKMNYRLGAFGGWYFPVRTDGQPKSNFALLDQRLAMKWVSDNIGSFNGDAEDITLAGASAGGAAVAIHLTHEDSYDYYNNAIVMSATTTPYWSEADASHAYAFIATQVQCATQENFTSQLVSGKLLECLQSIPIGQFKQAMAGYGQIFAHLANQSGTLSQMEFSFAPNFDGETLINDPRVALQNNNYKPDLGFLNIEFAANEATAISANLFSNPTMRILLFGPDTAEQLWGSYNQHVILPQIGYSGLLKKLFGEQGGPFLEAVFPCQPDPALGPFAHVMTDCIDAMADFMTGYLFTCPLDFAMNGAKQTPNLYGVVFDASTPGPGPDSGLDIMQPYSPPFYKCFTASANKACHIEGARYFFGEYINQNLAVTDAERDFGSFYRTTYADLIKNGSSEVLSAGANKWNRLSIENGRELISKPMAQQCGTFNLLAPNGAAYGQF